MASAAEESNQPDEELTALLESALKDFSKINQERPASEEVNKESTKGKGKKGKEAASKQTKPQSPVDEKGNVDLMWKELIDADPALKDHWEKLAESCSKAGECYLFSSSCKRGVTGVFNPNPSAEANTEEEFEKSLNDTLKNLTENAKKVLAQENGLADDELAKIWGKLGGDLGNGGGTNGTIPDLMPMVTNLMQNLLSKSVLYPALKDLTEKYPQWLKDNKDSLSEEETKRYTHQLDLMVAVCREFESEQDNDSERVKSERFQRILSVMQQMQDCGPPPKDLVGDVPDFNSAGLDLPKIPGLGGDGAQCSIQ